MATILIADDNDGFRRVLDLVLTADGHEVVGVTSGPEALSYLQVQTPDLIILDAIMPLLGGIEVCDRVKRVTRLKQVPLMILTSLKDPQTIQRAELAKADLVVNKPLEGKDFRRLVAKLIQRMPVKRAANSH
jgi:CheY-like chemotaxis protein